SHWRRRRTTAPPASATGWRAARPLPHWSRSGPRSRPAGCAPPAQRAASPPRHQPPGEPYGCPPPEAAVRSRPIRARSDGSFASIAELLDPQTRDGSADHQLLDLLGAFEDVIDLR